MSSKRYAPLSVTPEAPRLLAAVLLLGAIAANLAIYRSGLSWWLQLAGMIVVLHVLYVNWRVHVSGTAPQAIVGLERDNRGNWSVQTARRGPARARLLPHSTVFPGLVVLAFAVPGQGVSSIVLTPGRVDTETWRRLLVALRHARPPGD